MHFPCQSCDPSLETRKKASQPFNQRHKLGLHRLLRLKIYGDAPIPCNMQGNNLRDCRDVFNTSTGFTRFGREPEGTNRNDLWIRADDGTKYRKPDFQDG